MHKSQETRKKSVRKLVLFGVALIVLFGLFASACTATTPANPDTNSTLFYVVILVGIVAYGYFLIYRPRKKQNEQRKKQMESQKRGDEIITVGGIYALLTPSKRTASY